MSAIIYVKNTMLKFVKIITAAVYGLLLFFLGKAREENNQLNEEINNAKEIQEDRTKRDLDSDSTVRERMREFTRED